MPPGEFLAPREGLAHVPPAFPGEVFEAPGEIGGQALHQPGQGEPVVGIDGLADLAAEGVEGLFGPPRCPIAPSTLRARTRNPGPSTPRCAAERAGLQSARRRPVQASSCHCRHPSAPGSSARGPDINKCYTSSLRSHCLSYRRPAAAGCTIFCAFGDFLSVDVGSGETMTSMLSGPLAGRMAGRDFVESLCCGAGSLRRLLTLAADKVVKMSRRAAEPPSRRAAEPPSRRAAGDESVRRLARPVSPSNMPA